jgi:hypothetical protein
MNELAVRFRPEPLDALRARYGAAVATVHDAESVAMRLAPEPGTLPANVLDCEDGMRLIVSREDCAGTGVLLHLSASLMPGSDLFLELLSLTGDVSVDRILAAFGAAVEHRFRLVSGDDGPLEFLGYSPGRFIPHWVRRDCRR